MRIQHPCYQSKYPTLEIMWPRTSYKSNWMFNVQWKLHPNPPQNNNLNVVHFTVLGSHTTYYVCTTSLHPNYNHTLTTSKLALIIMPIKTLPTTHIPYVVPFKSSLKILANQNSITPSWTLPFESKGSIIIYSTMKTSRTMMATDSFGIIRSPMIPPFNPCTTPLPTFHLNIGSLKNTKLPM
jgi:hypothetical protein